MGAGGVIKSSLSAVASAQSALKQKADAFVAHYKRLERDDSQGTLPARYPEGRL